MSDIRDRMLGTRPSDRRSDVASGVAGSCVKRNVAGAPDFLPSKSIWGSTLDIKKSSTAHSLHGYNYTTTFPPLGAVEDISAVGAGGLPASQTMVAPSLSPLPSECASKGQPQGPFFAARPQLGCGLAERCRRAFWLRASSLQRYGVFFVVFVVLSVTCEKQPRTVSALPSTNPRSC